MQKSARRILADNLRARREVLRISQEDLGEISGLHRTYISSIERSQRNVGIDNLDRLAAALQLPLNELLLANDEGKALDGRENVG